MKFTNTDLEVLRKLGEMDISARDQLNLLGDTDVAEPSAADEETTDVLLLKTWVILKRELYLALCTNDQKYERLRKSAGALDSDVSTAVTMITSAVVVGIPAALLASVAKVLIIAVAQLGLNIFCKLNETDKVIGRLTQREQEVLKKLYQENVGAT